MTRLVVGLGNPGPEYERTRHNAGFLTVDLLGENLRATYWKDQGGAKVAVVRFGDEDLVLAKPQTFMNVSGGSVKRLAEEYGIDLAEMIVVHDDIDLRAGPRARASAAAATAATTACARCTRSSGPTATCACASGWAPARAHGSGRLGAAAAQGRRARGARGRRSRRPRRRACTSSSTGSTARCGSTTPSSGSALAVAHRVLRRAVDAHLEVQVRPGRVAGAAHRADALALADALARRRP